MTEAVAEILERFSKLSYDEKADLVDLLVIRLFEDRPEELKAEQMAVIEERIRQAEAGEVELIPAEVVMAEARKLMQEP